jgi:hypothetical protein
MLEYAISRFLNLVTKIISLKICRTRHINHIEEEEIDESIRYDAKNGYNIALI